MLKRVHCVAFSLACAPFEEGLAASHPSPRSTTSPRLTSSPPCCPWSSCQGNWRQSRSQCGWLAIPGVGWRCVFARSTTPARGAVGVLRGVSGVKGPELASSCVRLVSQERRGRSGVCGSVSEYRALWACVDPGLGWSRAPLSPRPAVGRCALPACRLSECCPALGVWGRGLAGGDMVRPLFGQLLSSWAGTIPASSRSPAASSSRTLGCGKLRPEAGGC